VDKGQRSSVIVDDTIATAVLTTAAVVERVGTGEARPDGF
jgi:hypothetical protein